MNINSRSANVKKNIILSFVIKGLSVGMSFLVLPITINYLTKVEYGVWVTLFTIMNWVNILDLGIGLGMRNRLAAAVAENNSEKIKECISTGMISIFIIGGILLVIFLISIQFVNFQFVFNTTDITEDDLYYSVLLTGIFVIGAFSLSTIEQLYFAYQKAAVVGIISLFGSVILFLLLTILNILKYNGIIYFVVIFGIATIISKLFFCFRFFATRREVIPSIECYSSNIFKKITNTGIRFFVIQICGILSLLMPNILITQLIGPEYVRTYDVVFKLLNFVVVVQNLILTPLWSAYTEAYVLRDYKWMKNVYIKTSYMIIPLIVALAVVGICISDIVFFWLNIKINVSIAFVITMMLYNIFSLLTGNSCALLNGVGMINLQTIIAVVMALTTIPIAIILVKFLNWGLEGIIATMTLEISIGAIVLTVQSVKLITSNRGE